MVFKVPDLSFSEKATNILPWSFLCQMGQKNDMSQGPLLIPSRNYSDHLFAEPYVTAADLNSEGFKSCVDRGHAYFLAGLDLSRSSCYVTILCCITSSSCVFADYKLI